MKVIHIDNLPQGSSVTSRTLVAGISAYNSGVTTGQERLDLEGITFDDYETQVVSCDPDSTLFLVTIAESELSRKDEHGQIVACRSLTAAHRIVSEIPRRRVFLIPVASGIALTGIDAIVGLLAGMSGVVDERGLVMNEVLEAMVNHQFSNRRQNSMLLIGELSSRVDAVKNMVTEWNMDIETEPTLDPACWRAAMALAQIDKLEPILSSVQPTSYSSLANALNLSESVTSFRLNPDDLRRVLSTLGRRWLGEDDEPAERLKLPDHARRNGFPRHRPVIVNLDCARADRKIFSAVQIAEVLTSEDVGGMSRRIVRLPNSSPRRRRNL